MFATIIPPLVEESIIQENCVEIVIGTDTEGVPDCRLPGWKEKMMKIIGLSILSRWGGQGEGERVPTREVRPFSGNWSDFSNRS